MSLLPAAMRLPDDITPLGKKAVPPAPEKPADPRKEFEKDVHPNPDGTKTYVKPPLGPKLFFGMDFAGGDDLTAMVTYAHKAMIDAVMLNANPPVVVEEKTATEILMKRRAAAERINKDYPTPWPTTRDLSRACDEAERRTSRPRREIVKRVKDLFGGRVLEADYANAIAYVNAMPVDDCPF